MESNFVQFEHYCAQPQINQPWEMEHSHSFNNCWKMVWLSGIQWMPEIVWRSAESNGQSKYQLNNLVNIIFPLFADSARQYVCLENVWFWKIVEKAPLSREMRTTKSKIRAINPNFLPTIILLADVFHVRLHAFVYLWWCELFCTAVQNEIDCANPRIWASAVWCRRSTPFLFVKLRFAVEEIKIRTKHTSIL